MQVDVIQDHFLLQWSTDILKKKTILYRKNPGYCIVVIILKGQLQWMNPYKLSTTAILNFGAARNVMGIKLAFNNYIDHSLKNIVNNFACFLS